MKKYMKPMMESENFVANEYVAVCWLVTCKEGDYLTSEDGTGTIHHESHGSIIVKLDNKPNFDPWDFNKDGFVWQLIPLYGNSYNGTMDNVEGPHPVTVSKITSSGELNGKKHGANAS